MWLSWVERITTKAQRPGNYRSHTRLQQQAITASASQHKKNISRVKKIKNNQKTTKQPKLSLSKPTICLSQQVYDIF